MYKKWVWRSSVASQRQQEENREDKVENIQTLFIQTLQGPIFPFFQHLHSPLLTPEDARLSRISSPNRSRDLKKTGRVALCLQPPTRKQKEIASCRKATLCWIYHFTCWKRTKRGTKRAEQTQGRMGNIPSLCDITRGPDFSFSLHPSLPAHRPCLGRKRDERNGRTKKNITNYFGILVTQLSYQNEFGF